MKQWMMVALLAMGMASHVYAMDFPVVSKEAFEKANALYDEQEVQARAASGRNGTVPANAFVRLIFDANGMLYSDVDYYANLSEIPMDSYYMTSAAAFEEITGTKLPREQLVMIRLSPKKSALAYDLYVKGLPPLQ